MSNANRRPSASRGASRMSAFICLMCALGALPFSPAQALAAQATNHRAAVMEQQRVNAKRVTGVVRDAKGEVLVGALVRDAQNPRISTLTNERGAFTLSGVRSGHVNVSYIGYDKVDVAVGDGSPLSITLKETNSNLSEVVVVGYGRQTKANLTGSVAQIKSEELQSRPVQNVSSALQGLMPGVTVTAGQGRPGADGSTIRVRGIGTLNNSAPYILIDGIEAGTLNSLDPNDIESISVLKDAASAAIYGSKASNGVILVTTKRGKTGKPVVSYNGNVGFLNATRLVERLSSYEYAKMYNDALAANGKKARWSDEDLKKFADGSDPDGHPNTDWYGLAYKTGVQHSHNVNVSGGTDLVKYMASAGYMNQEGILQSSNRERFTMRSNLDFNFSPKLTGHVGLNFIQDNHNDPNNNYVCGGSDQIIRQLNIIAPWIPAHFKNGTYGTISDGNPIAWLEANQPVKNEDRTITANLGLDYQLLNNLMLSAKLGHVASNAYQQSFLKYFRYNPNKETSPNNLTEGFGDDTRTTLDLTLNYDKQFGVHGLKFLGGYHAERYHYHGLSAYRKNFPGNELTDMNAGEAATATNGGYSRDLNMLSYFARVNYDLMGRYLFEANVRADASSRFAKGNRWGYFPSFSAAWRISEESFMENTKDWLNYLKIRGSWGLLGNQDALKDYYPAVNTYNIGGVSNFNGKPNTGYYQGSYKQTTISWEKARTWGVGVDFQLWNELTGSLDFYDRKTTGIIMKVPAPYEFMLGDYMDNVGAMRNTGVELTLGYQKKWGEWSFGAQANVSYNKNEILNLGGVDYLPDGNQRKAVGHALGTYYMYEADGFFPSEEAAQEWMKKYSGKPGYPFGSNKFHAGDLIYKDTNGDGKITEDDRTYHGTAHPKWNFGLVLNLGWRNFDFQAILAGYAGAQRVLGSEIYGDFQGDNSHPSTIWRDSWTYNKSNPKMPRVVEGEQSMSHWRRVMSSFWLNNTSHLRLKNIQLGYTLPQSVTRTLGISKMRCYYSVENLLTIDGMKVNTDPETYVERGSNYPLMMTNSLGISVTF